METQELKVCDFGFARFCNNPGNQRESSSNKNKNGNTHNGLMSASSASNKGGGDGNQGPS